MFLNHILQHKYIFSYYLQAIVTYWVSTNFVSLVQTSMLKIPYIRKALDMPTSIKHASPMPGSSLKNKNFTEEFRESEYYIVLYHMLE